MQTPVQVTVVEYVAEFFRQYKSRAYGKSISVNARGGADALMGMLKLVLSKGGREELRIALHCFKDQLAVALNSGPSRHQQLEELFALLSSLIDAAERLRQFSPVKESFSSSVLEEVRWRLFRIVVGDGFSEAAGIRRRALDIIFQSMQREQQEQQKSLARQQQLAAAATAAGGTPSRSSSSDLKNVSPSKSRLRGGFQRKVSGSLTGPDVSSWEGLWSSLAAMSGKKMLPLLQSVLMDLYAGKHMPGSPAAAASKAATTPQKQQHQQQPVQQQGSSCSSTMSAPTAAAPAPSRSDTAISMDVAAATSAANYSGSPTCSDAADPGFLKSAAHAVGVSGGLASSIYGVDTPPRQHSDGHETAAGTQPHQQQYVGTYGGSGSGAQPHQQQYVGTYGGSGSGDAQQDSADGRVDASTLAAAAVAGDSLRAMTEALQAHGPIRVNCAGSSSTATDGPGASPAAAAVAAAMQDDSSEPDTPASASTAASSSCLGSPTAAKRGSTGIVAKLRASVGGSNGSSGSNGGPAGWIPKGWVQFHGRDRSGGGLGSTAAAGAMRNTSSESDVYAGDSAAETTCHSGSDSVESSGGKQSNREAGERSETAAAAAFAGEDVDWDGCSPAKGSTVGAPAPVKL